MRNSLILLVLLLTVIGPVRAVSQPACLAYRDSLPRYRSGNPDSVLIDTCTGSATYGELYSRKYFEITFKYAIIRLPAGPSDTNLDVTWQAVDSSFPSARAALSALEAKYGTYVLRKVRPDIGDTSRQIGNVFRFIFSSYVPVDSIMNDLAKLPYFSSHIYDIGLQGHPAQVTNYVLAEQHWTNLLDSLEAYPTPISLYDLIGRLVLRDSRLPSNFTLPHGMFFLATKSKVYRISNLK